MTWPPGVSAVVEDKSGKQLIIVDVHTEFKGPTMKEKTKKNTACMSQPCDFNSCFSENKNCDAEMIISSNHESLNGNLPTIQL